MILLPKLKPLKPILIKRHYISFFLLAFLSVFVESTLAANENQQEKLITEWRSFNISTANNYIVPAYEKLESSALALNAAITQFCADPKNNADALDSAKEAFHQTMDAWQYIQNIQFGPIQLFMRNYSMQFWPDKKNHVGKHLTSLLQTNDPTLLSDSEFHKASVSIKGLPAIENFLFDEQEVLALRSKTFNCQVLLRITQYTADTSQALVDEWQEMKTHFSNTGQENGYFEDDIQASTSLLKALIEPIEVIRDLKILRPLGSEFGQQKVSRLESWKSQRSLRNIQINIQSLEAFYSGLNKIIDKNEHQLILNTFKKIQLHVSSIQSPIEISIESESGFKDLLLLSDLLKTLHASLEKAVIDKGIHLGFNSRDGD